MHFICANMDREYLARKSIVKNNKGEIIIDKDPHAERICCHCMPHENCGDTNSRVNDMSKQIKFEQNQKQEMMKKIRPELHGVIQQELNMEKE